MKHTIQFDLDNPLDESRFELATNVMQIMNSFTWMRGGIMTHLDELEAKKITEHEFVQKMMDINRQVEDKVHEYENAFWYVANDGMCEECQSEREAEHHETH